MAETKPVTFGGVVVAVLVAALLIAWLNGSFNSASSGEPGLGSTDSQLTGATGSTTHDIEYQVTGPARTNSITYQNANADTSQDNGAGLPWTKDMANIEEGSFLYVSAQNDGGGTITCTILVDGVEAESNNAHGQYAICTASGTL